MIKLKIKNTLNALKSTILYEITGAIGASGAKGDTGTAGIKGNCSELYKLDSLKLWNFVGVINIDSSIYHLYKLNRY